MGKPLCKTRLPVRRKLHPLEVWLGFAVRPVSSDGLYTVCVRNICEIYAFSAVSCFFCWRLAELKAGPWAKNCGTLNPFKMGRIRHLQKSKQWLDCCSRNTPLPRIKAGFIINLHSFTRRAVRFAKRLFAMRRPPWISRLVERSDCSFTFIGAMQSRLDTPVLVVTISWQRGKKQPKFTSAA